MKNAQVQSFINKLKDELSKPDYPVFGWHFSLDQPEDKFFNPYMIEHAEKAGFPYCEGMPQPEDFFYVSDDYHDYLMTLSETNTKHPANIHDLPWKKETVDPCLSTI